MWYRELFGMMVPFAGHQSVIEDKPRVVYGKPLSKVHQRALKNAINLRLHTTDYSRVKLPKHRVRYKLRRHVVCVGGFVGECYA